MLTRFLPAVFITILFSCEFPEIPDQDKSLTIEKEEQDHVKSSSIEEFSKNFSSVEDSLLINKDSFDDHNWQEISLVLVKDWIHPYSETVKHFDDETWLALFYHSSETLNSFCLAQIHNEDIRIYLLQLTNDQKGELIHLGNIITFSYEDSSKETGESYHFNITDCENLKLKFKNNMLYTSCERYTATVGKDWRVDQNLHVNDTVKLPIIENSYSLY